MKKNRSQNVSIYTITQHFKSQVPQKDLELASKSLVTALMIREKYMALSQQSFPQITARFLQSLEDREEFQGMTEGLNLADKKAMSGI